MRSSVLAEEAISRGFECIFVGEILGLEWVSARIAKLGFSQVIMDLRLFEADSESDVLILDSYSIPISDQFIAKKNWKLLLSICDEITPKYESDIELHPGLATFDSSHSIPTILSGANHVLIRKGIGKSKRERISGGVVKVLVVGGGSDPFGFVEAIAGVLSGTNLELEVHTITNNAIPDVSQVRFVKHRFGTDLDVIANYVDVVFTTASTSSLEFIAREIPTGVVCAVDNQRDYYNQLGSLGYASQLGVYNSDGEWDFDLNSIKELLENEEKQNSLRKATKSLIDLKGASRVVDTLVSHFRDGKN
jgi:spore coat polysaccharide biosynthesis predicted glycosyltransferase SpsG